MSLLGIDSIYTVHYRAESYDVPSFDKHGVIVNERRF